MPSLTRKPQPSNRLPEDIRAWVFDYADATGRSRSGLITQAVAELRARLEADEAAEQSYEAAEQSYEADEQSYEAAEQSYEADEQSLPAEEQAAEEDSR
jgi:hypothetical protein